MEFLDFLSEAKCQEYDQFVKSHNLGSFMQSRMWCNVKKGWKCEIIIVRDREGGISASMLVLIKTLPFLRVSFLYSPRGPVCDFNDLSVLKELMKGLKILSRRYRAYMFKCDPFILSTEYDKIKSMQDFGFTLVSGPNEIQCRCNYVLDIKNKTPDEIFLSFHKKWRYNIRLAERKGVVCEFYDSKTIEDKMDDFFALMRETGKRDGFYIRSEDYFMSLINELAPHCRLYLCYYQGKAISGAIAIQYAGKTCYVYGASSNSNREVMPNHLMQWNMIQWAIENGDDVYDFQGIPYYYDKTHPNYGVYRFKKGFNGRVVEYAGEFDYVFSKSLKKAVDCFYRIHKLLLHKKAEISDK